MRPLAILCLLACVPLTASAQALTDADFEKRLDEGRISFIGAPQPAANLLGKLARTARVGLFLDGGAAKALRSYARVSLTQRDALALLMKLTDLRFDSVRDLRREALSPPARLAHESVQHTTAIGEQAAVRRVVDVRLDNRRVDRAPLPALDARCLRHVERQPVHRLQGLRPESLRSPMERGNAGDSAEGNAEELAQVEAVQEARPRLPEGPIPARLHDEEAQQLIG